MAPIQRPQRVALWPYLAELDGVADPERRGTRLDGARERAVAGDDSRQRGSPGGSAAMTSASSSGFFSSSRRPTLRMRRSRSQSPCERLVERHDLGSADEREAGDEHRRARRRTSAPSSSPSATVGAPREQPEGAVEACAAATAQTQRRLGSRLAMYIGIVLAHAEEEPRAVTPGEQREQHGERVRAEHPDRVELAQLAANAAREPRSARSRPAPTSRARSAAARRSARRSGSG